MRLTTIVVAIVATALAFGSWFVGGKPVAQPSRVIETYSKNNGYFYRMKVDFEVKDTGEKLNFDYIAACNIRMTRWRDGGLSNDSTFSPRVMLKATAGGQAVMIKTLRLCSGMTSENDDVPPDVLPMAIWFDSVDDLSNGLGYVSEAAYESPIAKLRFRGARVEHATREDWEAWRKQAASEYVQLGALPGPWGYDYPDNINVNNPDIGKYVSACRGYIRLKLPDIMRPRLRMQWPTNRPRFWSLPNEQGSIVGDIISDSGVRSASGKMPWRNQFGKPGDFSAGEMPIRSGLRIGRFHKPQRWPAENYPFLWPPLVSASPIAVISPSPQTETYVQKLEFRDGAMNGFAACQNRADASSTSIEREDPRWRNKRHIFMVDNDILRERVSGSVFQLQPTFVMERDEFVFSWFSVGL
jgi:hypothetical protein